jgi:hypothetical protein
VKAKGYRIVAGDITSPIQKTIPSISKDAKKVQSDTRGFHKVAVVLTEPQIKPSKAETIITYVVLLSIILFIEHWVLR